MLQIILCKEQAAQKVTTQQAIYTAPEHNWAGSVPDFTTADSLEQKCSVNCASLRNIFY